MRIRRASIAVLLLLSLLSSGGGSFVSADLVGEICAKTKNPSFCLNFYKSDHSATTLVKLCTIAIDRGRSSAVNTKKLIDSLVKRTTDPSLKAKYEDCSENYDMAISNLEEARKSLKDPSTLNVKISAVLTDVETCEEGFGKTPVNPPKLEDGNQFLENVCSIGLLISVLMKG